MHCPVTERGCGWVSMALCSFLFSASQDEEVERPFSVPLPVGGIKVLSKVFSRTFGLSTSLPSCLSSPLQTWSLAVLDIWLCGLNLTHIPLYWCNGLWLIYSRPGLWSSLHCGHRQCSRPAWCGHGGELWQGPEWITDDRREILPFSGGTSTPWLMLGSDFDLYYFFGCQS